MTRLTVVSFLLVLASSACGAEGVRTVATPNGGAPQHALMGADGAIHLLYDKDNEPCYVKSSDGGATFSAPLHLVDEASKKPGLEFDVWDMALGKDGAIHVVLGNNAWKLKLPKDQWGLFFTTLEPKGAAFTPLRNINHEPCEGFSIAADAKGNVALCWLKKGLYCALSRDGGRTFSPGAELNPSYNPCPCCTTATAYGSDGKLAVLYREQTADERDIYMVLMSSDGRQTRQQVSTTPWTVAACPMTYFNVNPSKDGYSAAWPTKGDIFFARFAADGKVLPPGEIKTSGRSSMRSGVLTVTSPNGNTLVAWNSNFKLGWQVYDAKGASLGAPGSLETRGKGIAGVVAKDGSFLLFQ